MIFAMIRMLYVYEERIPVKLRELVRSHIPRDEFSVDEITYTAPTEEWINKLEGVEVVLFAPGRFLPDEVLAHAKHIKLMQLWSSGYDKFNVAGCAKYGIPVANNGGANACSVAEHALLLMLAVYKWLPDSHRRTVTGNWTGNSHGLDMHLLFGKNIGIIGFGNIGRYVAKKLSGFEARIKYFDINRATPEIEKEYGVSFVSFEDILKTSDILTLHLHNNKDTEGIIGARELAMMKRGAVLVNVSRAQLVDQDALHEALLSGKLGGAGVDVYMKEPTTGEEPLLKLPNVVATPHMAGSTYDTYAMVMNRAIENFRRVGRGEKPLYLISQ
jgi:phosphoglycerate dehydrogenase-like enzyme